MDEAFRLILVGLRVVTILHDWLKSIFDGIDDCVLTGAQGIS
jgi:hypothetical protein